MRILLVLAAAILQAHILIHSEHKVTLPNHSFFAAPAHKPIPLVYSVCKITAKWEVLYSGEVFVRIRSAKHDISNAFRRAHNSIKLFKCRDTPQRLLLLMKIDGTHNEAPQCLKPMHKTVYLFKEVKLNTLTHSANAAGL